jgi:hypothetical protein
VQLWLWLALQLAKPKKIKASWSAARALKQSQLLAFAPCNGLISPAA